MIGCAQAGCGTACSVPGERWSVIDEIAVCEQTGIRSSSRTLQTGSKRLSNSGVFSFMAGSTMPLSPASFAARISLTVASGSAKLSTASPAKRSGAVAQKSASQRL